MCSKKILNLTWSAIVNIALSCAGFELAYFDYLTSNNIVTLKSGLEVTPVGY